MSRRSFAWARTWGFRGKRAKETMGRTAKPSALRAPKAVVPRRRPSPLIVTPNTPETWETFCRWFDGRKLPRPPLPEDSLFVGDARGIVAGVCFYPTKGPYVLVENLATLAVAPLRVRHRAVVLLVSLVRAYTAARAKYPLVVVRHRGIVRLLARNGFTAQQAVVMTAPPRLEVP